MQLVKQCQSENRPRTLGSAELPVPLSSAGYAVEARNRTRIVVTATGDHPAYVAVNFNHPAALLPVLPARGAMLSSSKSAQSQRSLPRE